MAEQGTKGINLQLFAEPAGGDPPPANPPQAQPAQQGANATPEQIAASVLAAIEGRNKRTETGIVRSFAEQYGMSETEVSTILAAEKQRRANELSPEQKRVVDDQLAKANARLVSAEVKSLGAALGLVDTDAASLLMDRTKVIVKDDGTVEGVKEALEALKKSKPYLFGSTTVKATGMRQRGTEGSTTNAANDALRAVFGKEQR